MGRWMAPFAAVLINRSDVNPIGLEMVPPNVVIPALHRDRRDASPPTQHMTLQFMTCACATTTISCWHDVGRHAVLADADAVRPQPPAMTTLAAIETTDDPRLRLLRSVG